MERAGKKASSCFAFTTLYCASGRTRSAGGPYFSKHQSAVFSFLDFRTHRTLCTLECVCLCASHTQTRALVRAHSFQIIIRYTGSIRCATWCACGHPPSSFRSFYYCYYCFYWWRTRGKCADGFSVGEAHALVRSLAVRDKTTLAV